MVGCVDVLAVFRVSKEGKELGVGSLTTILS
jgi:hypothetical protein